MSQNIANKENDPPLKLKSIIKQADYSKILKGNNPFNYDEKTGKINLIMKKLQIHDKQISVNFSTILSKKEHEHLFCVMVDKKIFKNDKKLINQKRQREEKIQSKENKKVNKAPKLKSNPNVEIVCDNEVIIINRQILKKSNNNVSISKDFNNIQIKKTIIGTETLKRISNSDSNSKTQATKKTEHKSHTIEKIEKVCLNKLSNDLKSIFNKNNNMNKPTSIENLQQKTSLFFLSNKGPSKLKENPPKSQTVTHVPDKIQKIDLDDSEIVSTEKIEDKKEFQSEMDEIQNRFLKQDLAEEVGPITYDFKVVQGRSTSIQLFDTDIDTLLDGRYLNDKIIMFYLRFLQGELANPKLKGKFVILDSTLYQKVSFNVSSDLCLPLKSYDNSVKKWNRLLPLFDYEFLIFPICENEHWSLMIICNPGLIKNCFDNEKTPSNSDYPLMIYLDSFANDNIFCTSIFKKYLYYEYRTKSNLNITDEILLNTISGTHDYIRVHNAFTPKQPNFFDCGIYLLQYVELFLYDSEYFMNYIKNTERLWFDSLLVKEKRKDIQELISAIHKGTLIDALKIFIEKREALMKDHYNIPNPGLDSKELNPFAHINNDDIEDSFSSKNSKNNFSQEEVSEDDEYWEDSN